MGAYEGFWRAIPAGVIVALIVWMLPQADETAFFLILVFTWLIAGFFLPVLSGNIIGGTIIFTLLAWGQVRDEVEGHD